jgi:hypothetical protein
LVGSGSTASGSDQLICPACGHDAKLVVSRTSSVSPTRRQNARVVCVFPA